MTLSEQLSMGLKTKLLNPDLLNPNPLNSNRKQHMWGEAGLGGLGAEMEEEETWQGNLASLAAYIKVLFTPRS